jgi:hypothetical protein
MPHQLMDELAAIGTKTGNPELCFTPFANLLRTAVEAVVLAPSIAMVRACGCSTAVTLTASMLVCLPAAGLVRALLLSSCCGCCFGHAVGVLTSPSACYAAPAASPPLPPQALRPRAGSWMYLRFNVDELSADEISAGQYLAFKEQLVEGEGGHGKRRVCRAATACSAAVLVCALVPCIMHRTSGFCPGHSFTCRGCKLSSLLRLRCRLTAGYASSVEHNPYKVLEIDLGPFNRNFPRMNMAASIGQGVTFLNRHLSSSMFQVRECYCVMLTCYVVMSLCYFVVCAASIGQGVTFLNRHLSSSMFQVWECYCVMLTCYCVTLWCVPHPSARASPSSTGTSPVPCSRCTGCV